jgi:predicted phage terminase large subunit-like protein
MSNPEKVMLADGRLRDAIIRSNFSTFVQKTFETLSPSDAYSHNWHIDAITHKLELVRRGEIKRLVICVPPRSMKSTICSVAFPAFVLGHDPTKRIICISYGADLAVKLGIDCREVMSSSWYREIFPQTQISRHKNTESEFATTRFGYRMSSSIKGSLTGRGGDIIILDDPIKPIDALSDDKREEVNDAFFRTILSRLNNKQTGAIIVVMQRLHEDDLVGRLLRVSPDQWDVLILPAIAEKDEEIDVGQEKPHFRRIKDVLHPEREPLPILESLRAQLGLDVFSAQYQQSPVPREGAMIKRAWPRRYDRLPERNSSATVIQSWDPAIKESEQADYSVCTTWLYQDKRYYLVDVFRDRIDYPTLKAQAISLAGVHKPNVILIEDAGGGTALARELQGAGLPAVAVKPQFDKRTRMSIQSAKFANGQVFLPSVASWLDDLELELFSFPGSRYDDQIDSISQALAYEIPGGEWMTDAALKGYAELTEALCFDRLFSGR